jgi:hypothetical protein
VAAQDETAAIVMSSTGALFLRRDDRNTQTIRLE